MAVSKDVENLAMKKIGGFVVSDLDPTGVNRLLRFWELQVQATFAYANRDRELADRHAAEAARVTEGLEGWQLLASDAPPDVVKNWFNMPNKYFNSEIK